MEKPFKISVVIGTRPEAIKLSELIIKFKKNKNFHLRIILTGQHKEMVNQVMNLFDLKADTNFEIMKDKQTLNDITNKILEKLTKEFKLFKPDLLIVTRDYYHLLLEH